VRVRYSVKSEIVVSEARLEQLRSAALLDQENFADGQAADIRLVSIKLLDSSQRETLASKNDRGDKIALVTIESLWTKRFTPDAHFTWLNSITRIEEGQVTKNRSSDAERFARWQLETAKHYMERHEFLANHAPVSTPQCRTFELARHTRSQPASGLPAVQFASQRTGLPETISSSPLDSDDELLQLSKQVEEAEIELQQTELAWQEQIGQLSGMLQIASVPIVSPKSNAIPLWMAASVLILGLASGSTAGWLQHRLQSGGAFDSRYVGRQLAFDGIPIVATVTLPDNRAEVEDWMDIATRQASLASRRTARKLTQLSEWMLAFWVILIAGRLALDPLWRNVVIESPLAAFGRIIAGMP
jgi:hypothetical protein